MTRCWQCSHWFNSQRNQCSFEELHFQRPSLFELSDGRLHQGYYSNHDEEICFLSMLDLITIRVKGLSSYSFWTSIQSFVWPKLTDFLSLLIFTLIVHLTNHFPSCISEFVPHNHADHLQVWKFRIYIVNISPEQNHIKPDAYRALLHELISNSLYLGKSKQRTRKYAHAFQDSVSSRSPYNQIFQTRTWFSKSCQFYSSWICSPRIVQGHEYLLNIYLGISSEH